jgi:hypothetical protein
VASSAACLTSRHECLVFAIQSCMSAAQQDLLPHTALDGCNSGNAAAQPTTTAQPTTRTQKVAEAQLQSYMAPSAGRNAHATPPDPEGAESEAMEARSGCRGKGRPQARKEPVGTRGGKASQRSRHRADKQGCAACISTLVALLSTVCPPHETHTLPHAASIPLRLTHVQQGPCTLCMAPIFSIQNLLNSEPSSASCPNIFIPCTSLAAECVLTMSAVSGVPALNGRCGLRRWLAGQC